MGDVSPGSQWWSNAYVASCRGRRQLGAQGCRAMLAVPVSFVSEHIETLEEMDMEYRELVGLGVSVLRFVADSVQQTASHIG